MKTMPKSSVQTHLPIKPLPIAKNFLLPVPKLHHQENSHPHHQEPSQQSHQPPLQFKQPSHHQNTHSIRQSNISHAPSHSSPTFSITLSTLSLPHYGSILHHSPATSKKCQRRTKLVPPVESENKDSFQIAVALCSTELEIRDGFLLRKALKSRQELKETSKKKVENPFNFMAAPMVTTLVRSPGSRTQNLRYFLEKLIERNEKYKID